MNVESSIAAVASPLNVVAPKFPLIVACSEPDTMPAVLASSPVTIVSVMFDAESAGVSWTVPVRVADQLSSSM